MNIANVKMASDQLYVVPAELLESREDGTVLVRFAAYNTRIVALDLLLPATVADRQEFEDARAQWIN